MATTNIGPKIGIDGEAEFRKQITNINQQLKTLGSEMKVISSEFANNGDAQSALMKTTKNLTDSIAAQRSKIDLLTEQWEKSAKALGENDTKTLKYKQLLNEAKVGILCGSLISALFGCILLQMFLPKAQNVTAVNNKTSKNNK